MSQNSYEAEILGTKRTVRGWTKNSDLLLDDGTEYIFKPLANPVFDFTNWILQAVCTLECKPEAWELGGELILNDFKGWDTQKIADNIYQYRFCCFLESPFWPFKFLDSVELSPDRRYEDIYGNRNPDPRLKVSHVAWFHGIEDPVLLESFREIVKNDREISPPPEPPVALDESELKRVIEVYRKLSSDKQPAKAPLANVFSYLVFERFTQNKTAERCNCVPALISKRVKEIERRFGIPIKRLRNYGSQMLEMSRTVKGDRYVTKKQGAVQLDTGGKRDDDPGKTEEDEAGFLPEERE